MNATSPLTVAGTAGLAPRRLLYLMNDFVVQEHVCNLRCSYCLNFENENLKPGQPWVPLERIDLNAGGFGWQRARNVLEACHARGDAPILRLAGGEIMAIAGSLGFIAEEASKWQRIQVLTNATFLERDIERLKEIPNLNLCCSVDGHTTELNRERTPNARWAQRIISGLLAAIGAGVPVEVYMVLTHANVHAVYDFAAWLRALPRKADVRLLPFPVRGKVGGSQRPSPAEYDSLRRLLAEFVDFAEILPPRAFLERLLEFCVSERRSIRCRVPLAFMQAFDDGVIASCSNCWASPLGNILEQPSVFDQVGEANIHKLFLRDPPRFPFCKTCFTPFDVVNTYLDGVCTLEEIGAMDLYSTLGVRRRLEELRGAWQAGPARGVRL